MLKKLKNIFLNHKINKKKLIVLLLIISVIGFAYTFILPEFLNVDRYKPQLLEVLTKKIKYKIKVGELSLDLPPTGHVVLKSKFVEVKRKNGAKVLYGENIKVRVAIIPIFHNEIFIKEIAADNITANISKKSKGGFDIEDLIPKKDPNEKYSVKLIGTKIKLKNYNINIIDKHQLPFKYYKLSGPKLEVLNLTEDKLLKLRAEGKLNGVTPFNFLFELKLPFEKELLTNNFKLKGQIINLNLLNFATYLKNEVLSGVIDSDFDLNQEKETLNVNFNTKIRKRLIIPRSKIDIKEGYFKVKTSLNKDKISIENISTDLNTVKSDITGEIYNWKSKNPKYSINLSSSNLRFEKLSGVIPSFLLPSNLSTILESRNIKGLTNIKINLNNTSNNLLLSGQVDLKNYSLKLPNNYIIKDINSRIIFIKDKMQIANLQIPISQKDVLKINGAYNFLKPYFYNFNVKAKALDLNKVQNILILLTSDFNIPNKFLKSFSIKGSTDLNINFKGPLVNLSPYGKVKLSNVQLKDNKKNLVLNDINGLINLNNDISFSNLTCNLENNKIIVLGKLNLQQTGQILVKIPDFKLNTINILAKKLDKLPIKQKILLKNTALSGSINANLLFKFNKRNINASGSIIINKAKLVNNQIADKIEIPFGNLRIADNNLYIRNLSTYIGKNIFNINGTVQHLNTNNPNFSLELTSNNFNIKDFKKNIKKLKLPDDIEQLITNVNKTSGKIKIKLTGNKNNYQVALWLNNFNTYLNNIITPVVSNAGYLSLSKNLISFNNFRTNYRNSSIKAHGKIKTLKSPEMNISISGKISPLDFKEFIPQDILEQLIFSDRVSFKGSASGNIKNWSIRFGSRILPESKFGYKGVFQKPENVGLRFVVNGKGSDKFLNLENILFSVGRTELKATGKLALSEVDLVYIDNFHLEIPEIDLENISNFLDKEFMPEKITGMIKSDIKVNGSILNPDILGFINLSNVNIPIVNTTNLNANVDLKGRSADINDLSMAIKGTKIKLSSHIDNLMQIPFELSNLKIYSSSLRFSDFLGTASTKTQKANFVPITIKNGFIHIDDAIIDKLITSNLKGNISLCPSGLLQVNNLSFDTAGGNIKGNVYYNLLKETLGSQLKIVGVKANAIATIFLNLPNEVFGDMRGIVSFDTQGSSNEEFISNAQGNANLAIFNGKFSRLGTLEHLLTATNIIHGGITGLNLNNILASVIPMHTGEFQLLSGDLSVDKGILSTNNLSTRGVNLSLELSGNYNVTNDNANLKIFGTLPTNVSGLLGPLGKLNINTLTDFIPGLGFIPGVKSKKGILYYIPFLGSLPFFGSSSDKKLRSFSVDINGKLYDLSSVKNFQWVTSK